MTAASAPEEMAPASWMVSQPQIDAYAAAAGANDPIHVDPAREGGTIAQGMLVLAVMSEYVAAAVPNPRAWRERGELDVRFRAPARPGERLRLAARRAPGEAPEGRAAYELWCENEAGVRVVAGTANVPLDAFSEKRDL